MPYRCRFALHQVEGTEHIDLFIDVADDEPLRTYEIELCHLDEILNRCCADHSPIRTSSRKTSRTSIEAVRKGDHRRIYLEYSGPIERRGELSTVGFALLDGPLSETVYLELE